jgi:hypothetical protein
MQALDELGPALKDLIRKHVIPEYLLVLPVEGEVPTRPVAAQLH